nr:DUF664 domain-containing protein [Herbidospora galbida]
MTTDRERADLLESLAAQRRFLRHAVTGLIGEIAQHAGHADIIRETLDGQKTMG